MHMNGLSNYIHVPKSSSKSWSHTRRSSPVLSCVAYSIFVSASFNYTMHDNLRPQYISPLPRSISIHTRTHTHTHTPGAGLSPLQSILLNVLLWLNQIVYVCVCAHVCVCRLCVLRVYTVYMTRLIKAREPREPAAGMCIKVGETINLHIPSM
jgi:hypothetical protein